MLVKRLTFLTNLSHSFLFPNFWFRDPESCLKNTELVVQIFWMNGVSPDVEATQWLNDYQLVFHVNGLL